MPDETSQADHGAATPSCSAPGEAPQGAEDGVWVFAYGSLMWRPDFVHVDMRPARLAGWHRAMCILSCHYRGSKECPGLVLGLDRGGSCAGRAFRVAGGCWAEVRDMLHAREMITGVYRPTFLKVRLDDGRRVPAYAFVAERHHPQYWRGAPDQAAALIRQGMGCAGSSRDYLANTVSHLDQMGLAEGALHRLLRLVDGLPVHTVI
jgi:cation transport protein ChaC